MNKQNRYPGIRPFSSEDNRLFFGRSESIKRINRLFKLEKLIVLFGKSGLGKTSLVQAGAIPILQKEDLADGVEDFRFELLRFGAYHNGDSSQQGLTSETPVQRIRRAIIGNHQLATSDLFKIVEDDKSPWMAAKALQLGGDARTIVLILDQSEELFTWPQEEIDHVKEALQSLLNQNVPDAIRRKLHQAARGGEMDYNSLMAPPAAKAMLVIRSDKLDSLDQLADVLPDIYKKRYELPPLNRMAATEAILEPAQLAGEFSTPTFTYSDECLNYILDFLSNTSDEKNETKGGQYQERIEGFQLQLICQHAEFRVKEKIQTGESEVVLQKEDIGDLQEVTRSYYQRVLNGISDPDEREKVQVLVEEGLIYEAGPDSRRLSLFDGLIESQYEVGPDKLEYLGNSRLLRRVSLPEGGFSYEISHDSLLAPILAVKEVRKGVEQQAAEAEAARLALIEQQELDAAAAKERQRKRTAKYLAVVSILGIIALGGLGFSIWQTNNARKAERETKEAILATQEINGQLQATMADLEQQEALRDQLILDLKLAKSSADSSAAVARYQEGLARAEKQQSERINRRLFGNQMEKKYPWLENLEQFDREGYKARVFPEWLASGAKADEEMAFGPRTSKVIELTERAFLNRKTQREAAYHLAHLAAKEELNELTEALIYSLVSGDQYNSEIQAGPRKIGEWPTTSSTAFLQSDNSAIHAVGYGDGTVKILNDSFATLASLNNHSYNYVSALDFSRDHLATAGFDGQVFVYKRGTYRALDTLSYGNQDINSGNYVRDLAFTDGGKGLMVAGDLGTISYYTKFTDRGGNESFNLESVFDEHSGYIMSLALSNNGKFMVSGDMEGALVFWEKNGRGVWRVKNKQYHAGTILSLEIYRDQVKVLLASSELHSYSLLNGEINKDPIFLSDTTGGIIASNPRMQLVDEEKELVLYGSGNHELGIWSLANNSYGTIWKGNPNLRIQTFTYHPQDELIMISDELGNSHRIFFEKDKDPITFDDLVNGNIPEIDRYTGFALGIYDLEELESLERQEKLILFEQADSSLNSSFNPGSQNANILQLREELMVQILSEDAQSKVSASAENSTANVMRRMLSVMASQLNNGQTIPGNTSIFNRTLEAGQPGKLSKWLYWAWKWRQEEETSVKKYYAEMAYQEMPSASWEKIVLEQESVTPLDYIEFATDVNSISLHPTQENLFFATMDVDAYTSGGGMYEITDDKQLEVKWEIEQSIFPEGTVTWDSDFSTDGRHVVIGASSGEAVVFDTEERPGVAKAIIRVEEMSIRKCAFLTDEVLLLATTNGWLFMANINQPDEAQVMISDTISHGAPVSSLVTFPNGKWLAGLEDGRIISGNRNGVSKGGSIDLSKIIETGTRGPLALGKSLEDDLLIATFQHHGFRFDLNDNYSLNPIPDYDTLGSGSSLIRIVPISRRREAIWADNYGKIGVYEYGPKPKGPPRVQAGREEFFDMEVLPSKRFVLTANADNRLSIFSTRALKKEDQTWLADYRTTVLSPESFEMVQVQLSRDLGDTIGKALLESLPPNNR